MRICVVVPMHNEEAIAKTSIETILSYTKLLPGIVTVCVVNDGSQDATGRILEELLKHYEKEQLRLISHTHNRILL